MPKTLEEAKAIALSQYPSFEGMDTDDETSDSRNVLRASIRGMTAAQVDQYLQKSTLTPQEKYQRLGEAAYAINAAMKSGGRRSKSRTRRGKRRGRKTRRSYV